jgi:uncharacterized membrane protein
LAIAGSWDAKRRHGVNLILVGLLLFFLVLQLTTIAIALHFPVDILFVMNLSLAALFILIGNYLGKLRRNFWACIRTPWTLANSTVWERTHRLGGWLFVGVGFLAIIVGFVPFLRMWGMLVLILLASAFLVVYSYVVYWHMEAGGGERLSPPFDQDS